MKIAWIQDLDPITMGGGAQLNDRAMIYEGLRRGHEIQVVVIGANLEEMERPYDLAIVSNAMSLSASSYDDLLRRGVPYMFFAHDFGPQLCKWRLLYSMEERCRTICYLRDRWRPALMSAAGFVWLSPLHREAWLFAYPELEQKRHALVPSAIDARLFFPQEKKRSGAICVNSLANFKGAEHVIAWAEAHPDIQVSHVGGIIGDWALPQNMTHRGTVPWHRMNDIYNEHEVFLHLPANTMPFDRTVVEAYLAGCRLIVNKNVGAISFPWFTSRASVQKQVAQAPLDFWAFIESCLNQA